MTSPIHRDRWQALSLARCLKLAASRRKLLRVGSSPHGSS